MATLYRIELKKAHLDQIPHDERIFYFMASQLANDLNVIAKLLIFAANGVMKSREQVQRHVATTQALLFVKMMAGRLHEGKRLLSTAFFNKGLWKKYKDDLPPDARTNLEKINSYFGKENMIEKIRNKFAFHSDLDVIEDMYANAPKDAPFIDYHTTRYNGHSLYYGAEALALNAMLKVAGEPDSRAALLRLTQEPGRIAALFTDFIQSFTGLMLTRFIGLRQEDLEALKVDIADGPVIDDVTLPHFCVPSDMLLGQLRASKNSNGI
jgi:superfamily I DNA/RNA helicase